MSKDSYIQFCKKIDSMPIFSQPWWLDIVVGRANWDVVIIEENGQMIASLPFVVQKKIFWKTLSQPDLTPFLGPWINSTSNKKNYEIFENKLLKQLIRKLPHFDYFYQNWNVNRLNWREFYLEGFNQTTKYTYMINDLSDLGSVWNGFEGSARRQIRKAIEKNRLEIFDIEDIEEFIALNRMTFDRKGLKTPYNPSLIRSIDKACIERGCRKIFIARDIYGINHAAIYLVWDSNTVYYLLGGINSSTIGSGAMSLCMWEGIKLASKISKGFNFEGSMIESIASFFRSFGPKLTPYFSISKSHSLLLSVILTIRKYRGGS